MTPPEKKQVSRKEFSKTFRKSNPILPGTGGKLFSGTERLKFEKKLFGRKIDTHVSKDKYKKMIRRIGSEKYKVKTITEKEAMSKKIKFLKKLGKKLDF